MFLTKLRKLTVALRRNNQDLTTGNVWTKLIIFFLPIVAGSFLQQLYVTADSLIVGRFAGAQALAAIEAVSSLLRLPTNFFIGLSAGASIIISQTFGARDREKLIRAVHTAMLFAVCGGVLLSLLGMLVSPMSLKLLNIPVEIYDRSMEYTLISFGGMFTALTYNIGAGILRALGDSRTPFRFLLLACITNVVLDLLFVGVFKWSVAGAAAATVIAQTLSALMVLWHLSRTDAIYRLQRKHLRFHPDVLKSIFLIGLPTGVQAAMFPIANLLVQSRVNGFGTNVIAAWAVSGKVDILIWLIIDAFGSAISIFVAQNYGAKLYDRAKRGVRAGICLCLMLIIPISIIIYIWCEPLSRIFISNADDAEVITICIELMHFFAPTYVLYIGGEVLSGAIRGTGETLRPMILTILGTCATRIIWILFVVPFSPTLITVVYCYPVSWFLSSLMFAIYYHFFKNKKLIQMN